MQAPRAATREGLTPDPGPKKKAAQPRGRDGIHEVKV